MHALLVTWARYLELRRSWEDPPLRGGSSAAAAARAVGPTFSPFPDGRPEQVRLRFGDTALTLSAVNPATGESLETEIAWAEDEARRRRR
jgi:hypothetical protein